MLKNIRLAAFSGFALGVFAVSGCSSQDSIVAENESAESVAEKVAKSDITPRPGRWESTLKIEKLDFAGMPPEAQEMMKQHMGTARTSFNCLTPEEVEKPDAEFFQQDSSGCTYDKFVLANGKLDAQMTCVEDGAKRTMSMAGTYGEESYNLNVSADGQDPGGQPMSMAMSVTSRRVGECTGEEEQ